MRIRLSFALLIVVFAVAEPRISAQRTVKDSIRYYKTELTKLQRRTWDSLKATESFAYNLERLRHLTSLSKGYMSFVLFGEAAGADYAKFNQSIALDGFNPMKGPIYRFGFGISHRARNGVMVDLNFFSVGFNRQSANDTATVRSTFSDLFQIHIGYAVVNSWVFSIYPYVGLSVRASSLSYSTPSQLNTRYNSIAGIIRDNESASANTSQLSYQAGLGFDWVLGYNRRTQGGTILFCKAGTDGIFGAGTTYKIESVHYDPGIKYGNWVAAIGFKFFGK